jgi:hypothetical protein
MGRLGWKGGTPGCDIRGTSGCEVLFLGPSSTAQTNPGLATGDSSSSGIPGTTWPAKCVFVGGGGGGLPSLGSFWV